MLEDEKTPFNRRNLVRGAMLGGASMLLAGSASASPLSPAYLEPIDVRKWGALGDGKTDDTAALQRALDEAGPTGASIYVPPGTYLTRELHLHPGTTLTGVPGWNYSNPGGSVLRLLDDSSRCLLNLTEARGATIDGLSLDGGLLGKNIHGIALSRTQWGQHEDSFRIERCQVLRFSGDGAHLACVWCFSVRHSMFAYCAGDGLNLRGWDGFLIDNWFSGNQRAGFAARQQNASVTFTANRIEWNREENMLIAGGDGYQITGNFFDRSGTCGLALRKSNRPCTQISVTGNFFKRSGKFAPADSHDSAHILIEESTGVTCIGNNMQAYWDDNNAGTLSPSYGIVYQGLENCVIRDNVLHNGAMRQLLFDLGGHHQGVIVGDNPGRLLSSKP